IVKDKKLKVEDVKITGNSKLNSSQLEPQIAVQKEHLLSRGKFSEDLLRKSVANLKEIRSNYLKAGYLTASFRQTAHAISKNDPHRIDVVYHIDEGPRVITGDIITLGREHTRQRLIDGDIVDLKAE